MIQGRPIWIIPVAKMEVPVLRLQTIFLLLILSLVAPTSMQAADPVTPEEIRSHIYFLAHNLLTGRGIGTTGGDLATAYIETIFQSAGLAPAFGASG
jgi:hypothetical protein